jgi:WD40 repeat protein
MFLNNRLIRYEIVLVVWVAWVTTVKETAADGPSPVTALVISPVDDEIIFAHKEQLFRSHLTNRAMVVRIDTKVPRVMCLRYVQQGRQLLIAGGLPGESGSVELIDLVEKRSIWFVEHHSDVVYDLDVQAELFVSVSHDQHCHLVDLKSGVVQGTFQGHSRPVMGARFMNDVVVSVSGDSSMRIWDAANQRQTRMLDNHRARINGILMWPPSSGANPQTTKSLSVCCTISDDKTVRFWQPSIGRMVRFYQMKSAMPLCMAPAVNRTGGFEVTVGTSDGRIITVDYKTVKVQFEKQVSKVGIEVIAKHPHKEAWMTGDSAGVLRIVSE